MITILQSELDDVSRVDAKFAGDAANLALFVDGDAALGRRDHEEAADEREFLLVGGLGGELTRHEEVVGRAEQAAALAGEPDDQRGLVAGKSGFARDEHLHRALFVGGDVLVGVRHATEQVRELGQVAGSVGREMLQRVDQGVECARPLPSVRGSGRVGPEPAPQPGCHLATIAQISACSAPRRIRDGEPVVNAGGGRAAAVPQSGMQRHARIANAKHPDLSRHDRTAVGDLIRWGFGRVAWAFAVPACVW